MIPTPPNPAKADQLLDSIRASLDSWDAAPPGEEGDDVELEALRNLADRMRRLDTHLSMGGTPPTAWTEGPDEPLADDQPAAVVITGNPVDGLIFYGPFPGDDGNAAGDWASANLPGAEWWTATVKAAD